MLESLDHVNDIVLIILPLEIWLNFVFFHILFQINEEANNKVLEVEQKYNEIRKPVYNKRNDIIKSIPDFWLTAVSRHFPWRIWVISHMSLMNFFFYFPIWSYLVLCSFWVILFLVNFWARRIKRYCLHNFIALCYEFQILLLIVEVIQPFKIITWGWCNSTRFKKQIHYFHF